MVVTISINDVVYTMEGIHKIRKVSNKPLGRPPDMKRNLATLNIYRSKYMKKKKNIEQLKLSQDSQLTSEL